MTTKIETTGLPTIIIESDFHSVEEEIPVGSVADVLQLINPLAGFVVEKKGQQMNALEAVALLVESYEIAKKRKKSSQKAILIMKNEIKKKISPTIHNCILIKHNSAPASVKIIGEEKSIDYDQIISITYDKIKYIIKH